MDTCVRGFSFIPDNKIKIIDLKYVEENDLERTWKATRRERLKHQEEKIWEEFVKEQDIVRSMCKDDPYQFVDQLPQECFKELLNLELQKIEKEKLEEVEQAEPQVEEEHLDNQHVTFVEDSEDDMFHIFDEDRNDEVSGPEEELLNESPSPPLTVREREAPSPDKASTDGKSSNENVSEMIESSIYCAKVKDLRLKMIDEMNNIISFLERVDVLNPEPEEAARTMRRAAEFGARFGRMHLYRLHGQISDIERRDDRALPFGARTHFRAQLSRVSALHNNLLRALRVLLRALPQTLALRESGAALSSLAALVARAGGRTLGGHERAHSPAVEEVRGTCDKLAETLDRYTAKMTDYLSGTENTSLSRRSSKISGKKRSATWSRSGKSLPSSTEARLSMYSLDTRLTLNKSSSSKDHSSGTSKKHASIIVRPNRAVEKEEVPTKGPKKSPRRLRPLMRAPGPRGRPRAPDAEVRTLVEAVPVSTLLLRGDSTEPTPRKQKEGTPRQLNKTGGPETLGPSGNVAVETSKNSKKSPAKKSQDVEAHTREEDETPKGTVETVNTTEKKDIGEEKIRKEEDRRRSPEHQMGSGSFEVTRLLRQLCGGDAAGSRSERISGAKNARLLCMSGGGGSPRPPSTPQLLRILEETIQKKAPKTLFPKPQLSARDKERYRMTFNISERVRDNMFQQRTKFVQHMLSSALYANSAVGKPWEEIGRVSDQIIDELLLDCAKEMEVHGFVRDLYKSETC